MKQNARGESLSIYTIYERPKDYPQGFVVRRHEADVGVSYPREASFHPTLEAARDVCKRMDLHCIPRDISDDACIVESWL